MFSGGFGLLKSENQNEVDHLYFEEQPAFGAWEQEQAYDPYGERINFLTEPFGLYEIAPFSFPPMITNTTSSNNIELYDFEEISGDLGLWDFNLPTSQHDVSGPDNNQQMISFDDPMILPIDAHFMEGSPGLGTTVTYNSSCLNSNTRRNGRFKSSALELEEIQKYFDVPITRAAKELNVGLTVLKKRCRELNILRWPHRKLKSLKSLIHNVKELGLSNEVAMLEEHKRLVERVPEMELTERTKKLRQACFKANYKKRRSLQQQAALA